MSPGNSQWWLTCASDVSEAWKAILLARSLRKSLTTRSLRVLVSEEVPVKMIMKLQREFDSCIYIGNKQIQKEDSFGGDFSLAAIIAWTRELYGVEKFVFLNCNCLVIKNSDVLFRRTGIAFLGDSCRIGILISFSNLLEIVIQYHKGCVSAQELLFAYHKLDSCYNVTLNLGRKILLDGMEWKILNFPMVHPLDWTEKWEAAQGTDKDSLDSLEMGVLKFCGKLLPENLKSEGGRMIMIPLRDELRDSVAIIGMACRFPGANNLAEFWSLLSEGREGIGPVPDGRWLDIGDGSALLQGSKTSRGIAKEAGFLSCPVDTFDAKFFATNATKLYLLDPQQRVTLRVVWEGLEHAGIDPISLKNSPTGVFGGWWRQDNKELLQNLSKTSEKNNAESEFFRVYMGNALGTFTARISHFLDLVGPSVSNESACTTSMMGVDMACSSLRNEACDLALAVGVNLLLRPFSPDIMKAALSPDGRCKTFDSLADGFGRAEGVGVLVLKRYQDAVADGDKIWGCIRGSAVVQEGPSRSMGTPTSGCEASAMSLALERSGVEAKEVSYVEAHGTGTAVGDPIEMSAMAKVYSEGRPKNEPLIVGSVKTNIGHTESVCGIAGIIKTVLAMDNQIIPQHLNFKSINPEIDLSSIPAQIPWQSSIPWTRSEAGRPPRIAGISSFGITGADAHLILQEPPTSDGVANNLSDVLLSSCSTAIKLFTFSGKTQSSLQHQLASYRDHLAASSGNCTLEDVEFTMHVGRSHFPNRKVLLASNIQELLRDLEEVVETNFNGNNERIPNAPPIPKTPPKICFIFTGQGSQYPGMAKGLYHSNPVFQSNFDQAHSILKTKYGMDIKTAMWTESSSIPINGQITLKRSLYSQTCIFVLEYCLLKLWESWGVKPNSVLGHSLGEFGAAVAAGLISFEDALHLVVTRSRLIDSLPSSSMLVVRAEVDFIQKLVQEWGEAELDIAAMNSKTQTVLAGSTSSIHSFSNVCENNGLKATVLDSSHAFHSKLMDPILDELAVVASNINYACGNGDCPYISGMEGGIRSNVDASYWVRHTRQPVKFMEASHTALKNGNRVFLEIGPHPVLSAMILNNADEYYTDEEELHVSVLPSLRKNNNDMETMLGTLGKLWGLHGLPINWANYHRHSSKRKIGHLLPGTWFDEQLHYPLPSTNSDHEESVFVHPLLGRAIPNPSDINIYRNEMHVGDVPFLLDHVMGDKVLFSGAASLEMLLTAGAQSSSETMMGSSANSEFMKPTSIQSFFIHSPLLLRTPTNQELPPAETIEFQVVVAESATDSKNNDQETMPENSHTCSLYTKLFTDVVPGDSTDQRVSNVGRKFKWVRHATATFLRDRAHLSSSQNDKLNLFESIQSRRNSQIFSKDEEYKNLEKAGCTFGPAFQTLCTGWSLKCQQNIANNQVKGTENGDEYLFEFKCTEEEGRERSAHILHPLLIDAMFQAHIFAARVGKNRRVEKEGNYTGLVVPIGVESFTVWANPYTILESGFIWLSSYDDAHLFDMKGELVASMVGAEYVETTIGNILAMIESQTCPMPDVCQLIWKDCGLGPYEKRLLEVNCNLENNPGFRVEDFCDEPSMYDVLSEGEEMFFHSSNTLYGWWMLEACKRMGVDRISELSGGEIRWPKIASELKVVPELAKLFRYILIELVADGWLEITSRRHQKILDGEQEVVFKIVKPFPSSSSISSSIQKVRGELNSGKIGIVDVECIEMVGIKLADILTGKISAIGILFPEGTNTLGLAELYYRDSLYAKKMDILAVDYVTAFWKSYGSLHPSIISSHPTIIRVLEVGAGTGSFTRKMISSITAIGFASRFEYTYTDISSVFLSKGVRIFEGTGITAKFGILNIEQDPLDQGFLLGNFDIIVATFVVHATRDIEVSVLNMKKLLRPGGYVHLLESVKPNRATKLLFGGLEQYWNFADVHHRPLNCEMDLDTWKNVFETCGFANFVSITAYKSNGAIISSQLKPTDWVFSKRPMKLLKGHAEHDDVVNTHDKARPTQQKIWAVFGDKDCPKTEELISKLQQCGRSVYLINRSSTKDPVGITNSVKIQRKLDKIFNDEASSSLWEGIAYLWGLPAAKRTNSSLPYLTICQWLLSKPKGNIRLIAFTQGNLNILSEINLNSLSISLPPHPSPIIGMTKVFFNENPSLVVKCVDVDPSDGDESMSEAISECWTNLEDGESVVGYRHNRRHVPRLSKPINLSVATALPIPNSKNGLDIRLVLPESNMISDLRFESFKPQRRICGEMEIEIRIKAYGLNFRDLMVVLKPDAVFEQFTMIGIDCAGIVVKVGTGQSFSDIRVGDRVMAARSFGEPMCSYMITRPEIVAKIPNNMTYSDAATLPVAYSTVAYCFLGIAKINEGDIVLIHTGSGAVGLAAIALAQLKNCQIVVTAGNKRKRAYLRLKFGLKMVFNSRTTEFEQAAREALGGGGVDVVLNSLTGPGFKEASLSLCNPGARFVEISKMNIWSKEEVRDLRPDVQYDIADLPQLSDSQSIAYFNTFREMIGSNFRPLPFTRFELCEIRGAFDFLQKAKHIGKIVVSMPEVGLSREKVGTGYEMFNENATYMITGGLGGIGLNVLKWMCENGAKHLHLVGRSPPGKEAEETISEMRSCGVEVNVAQVDIGNMEECSLMMAPFINIGDEDYVRPLRGIMHTAGCLENATFDEQTWEKYETVFNPKINGGWNLHELSLRLPYNLEHFVMFSSLAAIFGSPGQSNYVGGNQFLDSLTYYRYSLGLTACTINWGQWGQVGMAANMTIKAMKPFTAAQGLRALGYALKSHVIQTCVLHADVEVARKVYATGKTLLSEIMERDSSSPTVTMLVDRDSFWREYNDSDTEAGKIQVLTKYVKNIARQHLKLGKDEEIDATAHFGDFGIDSLMMVEMKNGIQSFLGKSIKITINALKDATTVMQMSAILFDLISGKVSKGEAEVLQPPSRQELKELILRDSILPENIRPTSEMIQMLKPLSQISIVFITGVTGTLGPYIMTQLLAMELPRISKVVCLMRPNKQVSSQDRFKKTFLDKQLFHLVDMCRVELIEGDATLPNFGLSEADYSKLASEVDAIFNLAVKSKMEVYMETKNPNHCRAINVNGMNQVLSLAVASGLLKHVFHASTIVAETLLDSNAGDERLSEDWPVDGEFDNFPNFAYPISKYICDRLVAQAVQRGVPCKAFRFQNFGGDSQNGGNFQIMVSQLMTRLLSYMQMGFLPDIPIPVSILPVNICANISLALFFNEETGSQMFNIANPYLTDDRDFPALAAEFGVKIKVVSQTEFEDRISKLAKGGEEEQKVLQNYKMSQIPAEGMKWMLENPTVSHLKYITGGAPNLLLSRKLCKYLPKKTYPLGFKSSAEILKIDLQYAKDAGFFDKFDIHTSDVN